MFGILNLFFKRVVPIALLFFLICRGIVLWSETKGGVFEKSLACLNNYKEIGLYALAEGIKEFKKAEKVILAGTEKRNDYL